MITENQTNEVVIDFEGSDTHMRFEHQSETKFIEVTLADNGKGSFNFTLTNRDITELEQALRKISWRIYEPEPESTDGATMRDALEEA